jgi:G3E family GTPase
MAPRTPITLVTGPLGSGKTTLLQHILATNPAKIAIVMNEFGEIAIDAKVIEGKNVRIAELGGGCVCCSLLGEFEAAVNEIIQRVEPEMIIVETTGLAEPEAIVFNIQEALPQCRLDGVVSIIDADALVRFPELGHTTRLQIESADILLLNKLDLIQSDQIGPLEVKLRDINPTAAIVRTKHCRVDPELLFGIGREKKAAPPQHQHQPELESFTFTSNQFFSRDCFERFADDLPSSVYRAKGFVRFTDGTQLFNFVAGRWDLEAFESAETQLVFIGKEITKQRSSVIDALENCEI